MGNSNKVKSSPTKRELNSEEQQAHDDINTKLTNGSRNYSSLKKLAFFGIESSGKSTILEQLSRIHGYGFMDSHYEQARCCIRKSCISTTVTLLRKSQELYDIDKKEYKECYPTKCVKRNQMCGSYAT